MRSIVLLSLIIACTYSCSSPQEKNKINNNEPREIGDGISTGSLADAGIDSTLINSLVADIQKGIYPNIHSLLISRSNKLVFEKYWPGKDGQEDIIMHDQNTLHDLRSVSKSIVSVCAGIAMAQGKIKSVDQKVFEFFPEYAPMDTGLKSAITIKHLLTMSVGLTWNEEVPYTTPENSETQMGISNNQVGFVLSRSMDTIPGAKWNYNGGATQLLATIVEKTTGKQIDQFAKEYLFEPMGITHFEWTRYRTTDKPAPSYGVRLRSRDMLKFGLLCKNKGSWDGKQIVPSSWMEESFQPHTELGEEGSYGYQFWLWSGNINKKLAHLVACVGNGDQLIFLDRDNDLLVIVTAGNYDRKDIEKDSNAMLSDYIYPALFKK